MENVAIGDRVGAVVVERQDGVVEFAGYGVYDGDFEVGPEAIGWGADYARQTRTKVPRLTLDNGDIAWGCEVWWGAEAQVKKYLADFKVEEVSMPALRAEYHKNSAEQN